jgi:hypothetical protein
VVGDQIGRALGVARAVDLQHPDLVCPGRGYGVPGDDPVALEPVSLAEFGVAYPDRKEPARSTVAIWC